LFSFLADKNKYFQFLTCSLFVVVFRKFSGEIENNQSVIFGCNQWNNEPKHLKQQHSMIQSTMSFTSEKPRNKRVVFDEDVEENDTTVDSSPSNVQQSESAIHQLRYEKPVASHIII